MNKLRSALHIIVSSKLGLHPIARIEDWLVVHSETIPAFRYLRIVRSLQGARDRCQRYLRTLPIGRQE